MNDLSRRSFLRLAGQAAGLSVLPWNFSLDAAHAADSKPAGLDNAPARGAVSSTWTENWESGMVSGNGSMGVVAYGKPEAPILCVNHNRLYTSQLDPSLRKPAETAKFVPEIRRLIREESYDTALDYAFQKSKENGLCPDEAIDFHPAFFLNSTIQGADSPTDYLRSENFETGEITTTWIGSAGRFRMRSFVSRSNNVIVHSVGALGPALLNMSAVIPDLQSNLVTVKRAEGRGWTGLHTLYAPGNGGYDAVVQATVRGGSLNVQEGRFDITQAHEVLFLIRVDRFRPPSAGSPDAIAASLALLPADYEKLLAPHVKVHGGIFNRVRLDLGGGSDRHLTTDVLLKDAVDKKSLSPALMEKIYDACRYVILSSSGDLPPNLQGLWTGTWSPAWHSDYSADANLQLAIGSTCSANMPELMEGFFSLVEMGVPSWREGAMKLAGCRGILYPARMQDQGTYFQQNHDWQWFNQVSIAGWLGHFFYDYYRYTGDRKFLKNRAIPYLKECALFYEDWYVADPDGTLRATPSFSYECAFADNATIDFAVAREVLSTLIEGCTLLGIEQEGVARWKAMMAKFPAYAIDAAPVQGDPRPHYHLFEGGDPPANDGTLKEFILPGMLEFPHHRHLSSLYPLFASYDLDPDTTPEHWTAAAKQYEKKIAAVQETESHYRMQASLCAARLGRGDDVWNFLTTMAVNSVFHTSLVPSHYDHLNVLNVDASGGIPAVVNNCLVFSLPGRLDLLPALPSALPRGSITGILARGGITIESLSWDIEAGAITAKLSSTTAQSIALTLPPGLSNAHLTVNGSRREIEDLTPSRRGCRFHLAVGNNTLGVAFEGLPPAPAS